MKRISVCFLVKDPPLARLLTLVEFLRDVSDDFIFAVDDRTEPSTIEVIKGWRDCRVELLTWENDFAAARNVGVRLARRDWTLVVDPDEFPSMAMMEHLREISAADLDKQPTAYVYWTPNWHGGVRSPDVESHWHIRLWKTGKGEFYRKLHELVRLNGQQEGSTRGSAAVHAPKEAYLIHSKGTAETQESEILYKSMGGR